MRLLRILTLITFLFVTIPDPKFPFLVFTMIMLILSGSSYFIYILFSSLSVLAIAYTLISLFLKHTQLSHKLNILSILIFYSFLLQFTTEFIKHHDTDSISDLLLFLTISLTNLILTIKQLKNT
jgi:hypothetical protein